MPILTVYMPVHVYFCQVKIRAELTGPSLNQVRNRAQANSDL